VEVAAERPRGHRALLVRDLVAVGVAQLGELVLLGHVDDAVDDRHAHRLLQPAGDPLVRDLVRPGRAGGTVHDVHLAEELVAATPGADDQPAVGGPGHPGDLRLEAGGPQVGQRVAGVHRIQREAVSRRVGHALARLVPGCGHADDAGVRAQHRVGYHGELRRTRRLPRQGELLAAAGLEVLHPQRVVPLRQRDHAVLGRGAVQPVVVDDEGVVDVEAGAVVAGQPERVRALGRDVDVAERVGEEVVLEAEVGRAGPVDDRHQLVDVRRLSGLERADLAERNAYVIGAERDTGLLGRRVRGPRGERRRAGGHQRAEDRGAEKRGEAARSWVARGHYLPPSTVLVAIETAPRVPAR
jgi:hypothetical protein